MKVLHLNYHEKLGGAAIATNRIHNALLKFNIDPLMLVQNKSSESKNVIPLDKKMDIFLDKLNLFFQRKLHKINSNANKYKISKSYNLLPTYKIKMIEKINPDIVNLHWIGNNFINFKEISMIKKPIVWTLHDMWPYCGSEHYSFQERYIDGYTKNNSLQKKFISIDLDKITWLKKKKYLPKKINFVPTSTWQENNLKKSFLFKDYNMKKIFYPIDTKNWIKKDKLNEKKKLGLPLNKKIILFISERIDNPVKGFFILKKILNDKSFNNYFLVILGEKNKELFEKINFDFRFIEKINDNMSALITIYSASDLLLAPSSLESFGIVAQEAASCSLPAIAFSDTGFEDTIVHKISGYIAKKQDLDDFKNGIKWCLDDNNHKKISDAARQITKNKFNEGVIASKYINLYKKLIKEF